MTALVHLAHGVSVRDDLPLPFYQFAWATMAAMVLTFVVVGARWATPRMAEAARAGVVAPAAVGRVLDAAALVGRLAMAALGLTVLLAAFVGPPRVEDNLAPTAVFTIFWVLVPIVSAIAGDVWRAVSPFEWFGRAVDRWAPPATPAEPPWWAMVVPVVALAWLELGYHDGTHPRVVGAALLVYLAWIVTGAVRGGVSWVRGAEGFGVVFSLIAAMAPLTRSPDGGLRVRLPFSGLAEVTMTKGTTLLVVVTLGTLVFDGFSGTRMWFDLVGEPEGWALTGVNTAGLVASVVVVGAVYVAACKLAGNAVDQAAIDQVRRFGHGLVPVVLGFWVAHYLSLLVVEGQQRFRILLSDPFDRGWDLFGTADDIIDFGLVGSAPVAWTKVGTLVIAHLLAVALVHDRAVAELSPRAATRAQYPLLLALVLFAVLGLALLFAP